MWKNEAESRAGGRTGDSILLASDVHCRFSMVNRQISHAEKTLGERVCAVIVLGDFGVFPWRLEEFFDRRGCHFERPLYFIEGNHEDFACLQRIAAKYSGLMSHLQRGTIRDIGGYRFLCLGGSAYMDAMNTPAGAEITPVDLAACMAHESGAADLMISHDCPAGIGVPGTPGFEFYGDPGFKGGLEIARRMKPGLWLFGHHHKWFETTHEGIRYLGIPEIWKGYALLRQGLNVTTVENYISEESPDFRERLRKILNP